MGSANSPSANTQIDYPKGVTFEQVWAALMENREQIRENAQSLKETERIIKKSQQETDRFIKESQRESQLETDKLKKSQQDTDRIIKEIGKRLGDFTNSFGDVVEHMIAPKLQENFQQLDLDFQMASKDVKIRDKKNDISFQIDIFLQNGDVAMLVEIKTTMSIGDINAHIERLEKMRRYADLHGDKRKFLGSVAGITISNDAKEYALNQGFYLIEPSGEDFCILPPYNKHKEW